MVTVTKSFLYKKGENMNDRQKNILFVLQKSPEFITAEKLAGKIGCSVKTVRNDLKVLKDFLKETRKGNIVTRSHQGIRLEITAADWETVKSLLYGMEEPSIFSKEEVAYICELLLKNQLITVKRLEERFYISHVAVERLLEKAKVWLEKVGIQLVRRRGQGISVVFSEWNWRIAMWKLFLENYGMEETEENSRYHMEQFLNGFDTEGVWKAIMDLETEYGIKFSYDSNQRLRFLLSIAVVRIRRGQRIKYLEEIEEVNSYDKEFAKKCADILEDWYQIQIPEDELKFLEISISTSEIHAFYKEQEKMRFSQANKQIMILTEKIIALADHIFQSQLKQDEILKETLFFYLKAAICRRKYGISQENPFVEQIKASYPAIYAAAWSIGLLVDSEQNTEFSEHEIAYLALHLGGALERQQVGARVCILCNYGIGISQIIKEQLQRTIGNLEIADIFSSYDRRAIRNGTYDFIISTIPVESPYEGKEVLQIGNILQESDIRRIREKTKAIYKKKYRNEFLNPTENYRLFSPQLIYIFKESLSKEELLHRLCKELFDKNYVKKEFEQSVFEREDVACTTLEKGVAIPHGISKYVLRPVIVFVKLAQPILWDTKETVQSVFLLALNLRQECGARDAIVRFYANLVSLLEEKAQFERLKEMEDKNEIAEFLNGLTRKES